MKVATLVYQARIIKEAAVLEVLTLSSIPSADTSEPDLLETAAARALATAERQHQPFIPHIGSGTSNKMVFDLAKEQERGRACIGPFYAGLVCTSSGSNIDIGVFTDKYCTILDASKTVDDYLVIGDEEALSLASQNCIF